MLTIVSSERRFTSASRTIGLLHEWNAAPKFESVRIESRSSLLQKLLHHRHIASGANALNEC
jgi:hypothetical protein